MASKHHVPANDAPEGDWHEHLRGLGYLSDQEPKPFANYYAFHGYWVPPRVGPGPEKAKKAAPRKRKLPFGIDTGWYSFDNLVLLHRHHRDEFDAIRARLADVERFAEMGDDKGRYAAQRDRLTLAAEAGTINQHEADRQLEAWARLNGVETPDA